MDWFTSPAPLLIGFAATNLVVMTLAVMAWRVLTTHKLVAQRVALASQSIGSLPRKTPAKRNRAALVSHLAGRKLPHGNALEIARRLERFHIPFEYSQAVFTVLRAGTALISSFLLAVILVWYGLSPRLLQWLGIAITGGGIGWFVPQLVVSRLVAKRLQAIERGLPDAIELLVISVEAGLALEDAIDRIVPELRLSQPVIAEELALTSADLKILPNRDAALHRLSERAAVASLHAVVSTLSQTMRYGTPLAQALRVVASELRNDSLIRLEERASKMPVLLTVPMIIFILPAVFMVIGGPTALRLIDTFFH